MKIEKKQEYSLPTGVLGMAASADGSKLFAACMDGLIYEVKTADGKWISFAEKHTSFASGCRLMPDQKTLISAGYDGCLIWHDVESKKGIRRVKAHDFWSWQMALSPDGKWVATVTGQYAPGGEKYEPAPEREPSIKLFNALTGELKGSLPHVPPVQSVAFAPDSKHFAAANMMGEVRIWDVETLAQPKATFSTPDFTSWGTTKSHHYCGGIYGMKFSPDGQTLLCCGMGPMGDPMAGNGKMTWQRWAWKESPPKKIDQIKESEQGSGLMETLAFNPEGTSFLMAGRMAQGQWNLALFDAASGALQTTLDTKSRVTKAHFASATELWLGITKSQPGRTKEGVWPDYGQIMRCEISLA